MRLGSLLLVIPLFISSCHYSCYAITPIATGRDRSSGASCERSCDDASRGSLICEYSLTVEWYHALSKACYSCPHNVSHCYSPHCVAADGVDRAIVTVNRVLPAPSIQVCANDTVSVTVHNHMANSEGLSIHWHGLHQRAGYQHMDGVGSLTQCDIHRHGTFRYEFPAVQPGTHFYHGHSGMHRADGLFGALVVRQPRGAEPHGHLYDLDLPEHVIVISDWMQTSVVSKFTDHHHDDGDNKPQNIVINGRGTYQPYEDPDVPGRVSYTPREMFTVQPELRHRFRMISNGILNCPIEFHIDGHTLLVIDSDGVPLSPITVDKLVIYAGERFDFIVDTGSAAPNLYWMRWRGLADCAVKSARQQALLRYSNAPGVTEERIQQLLTSPPHTPDSMLRDGTVLNPLNSYFSETEIPITRLNASGEDDITAERERADYTHYLAMDFYKIDNILFHHPEYYPIQAIQKGQHLYMPQVNGVALKLPSVPLLTQYSDLSPEDVESMCEGSEVLTRNCSEQFCYCTHYLKFPLNKVVELVLIDEGVTFNASHPFHLHGHSFRVVGMDKLGESTSRDAVMALDKDPDTGLPGRLPRRLRGAVLKDTVVVPDGGYTIIRFYTDNPGFWFLHCHLDFHVEIGMGIVIQAGEVSDMPRPPVGFPTCNNWPSSALLHLMEGSRAGSNKCSSVFTLLLCVFLSYWHLS